MVNLFLCHVTLMMHKALCNLKISDMIFFLSGTKCLILITDAVMLNDSICKQLLSLLV